MYLARYRKLIGAAKSKLWLLLHEGGILHAAVCQTSSAQEKHHTSHLVLPHAPLPRTCPLLHPQKRTERTEKSPDPPQRTVPLAHADTAQDSLLVGLAFSQILAHDVSAQAEAHNNQLGLRVGLLDVINHGTKFPGAT